MLGHAPRSQLPSFFPGLPPKGAGHCPPTQVSLSAQIVRCPIPSLHPSSSPALGQCSLCPSALGTDLHPTKRNPVKYLWLGFQEKSEERVLGHLGSTTKRGGSGGGEPRVGMALLGISTSQIVAPLLQKQQTVHRQRNSGVM